MNSDTVRNKHNVMGFYHMAFNERRPAEAVEKFVGAYYGQHNPQVADGAEGFIAFVMGFTSAHPELKLEIKRVIAEGDFVVLHVLGRLNVQDPGAAIMDIFRLQDGRIVEHWDVVQPIPPTSANSSGMF